MRFRHASDQASLRLVQVAVIAGWLNFALPIFSLFYTVEIGMDLGQIGAVQAAYTIVVLTVNVPTAWLADRYSRKACTVIGCLVAGAGFVVYAAADSFWHVVVAETISGCGIAALEGADIGLLESIAARLDKPFDDINQQTTVVQTFCEIGVVSIGGWVGVHHPRVTLLMTASVLFIGAVTSAVARDPATYPPRQPLLIAAKDELQDLRSKSRNIKSIFHVDSQLTWWIVAWGITQRIPTAVVWFFTPLLLAVGAPPLVVGLSWLIFFVAMIIGSFAARGAKRLSDRGRYAVCIGLVCLPALALAYNVNVWSVTLFCCFGLLRGWQKAVIPQIVLRHAPVTAKSTSIGGASLIGDALYVPAVAGIGAASDVSLHWGMLVVLGYVPLMLLVLRKLR